MEMVQENKEQETKNRSMRQKFVFYRYAKSLPLLETRSSFGTAASILFFHGPKVVLALNGVPRLSTIPARLVPEDSLTTYQFGEQRLSFVLPKKQTKEAFL
jgi:hypothetical protein